MPRNRTGPSSLIIKCSTGASNDPMSIYSTEYSARIGLGQKKIKKVYHYLLCIKAMGRECHVMIYAPNERASKTM